ncbi:MAG: hypothetical protein V3U60_04105 [Gammaproteobacteria bacterium]
MARHQRMPTQEAGYTYEIVPCTPSISLLAKKGGAYLKTIFTELPKATSLEVTEAQLPLRETSAENDAA